VIEPEGVDITELPVVVFKYVEGDQLYVWAPDAVSVFDWPVQTEGVAGLMVMFGKA
jgi:hypothetical protein